MNMGKIGVWLIGARGSAATTAVAGAAAMRAGLTARTGCVTELPDFAGADLPGLGDLVFGGHDVVDTPLVKRAEQLAAAGVLPSTLPGPIAAGLDAAEARLRPAPAGGGFVVFVRFVVVLLV